MSITATYLILFAAALLEAGGDALVRAGLGAPSLLARAGFFAVGAAVLFAYGLTVNAPAWDFGKLIGLYVTLFFLVAQAINLVAFGVRPDLPILLGGVLIMSGGLVIAFWRV